MPARPSIAKVIAGIAPYDSRDDVIELRRLQAERVRGREAIYGDREVDDGSGSESPGSARWPGGELEENEDSTSYSPEEEAAVLKKLDRHLVFFLAVLYLLSFLDRSNIGNAKIAGLTDDLDLSSSQYEWALTAFYITYVLFEWMTLLYRVVPAHIYIALCVAGWGLVASLQSLATSFATLTALRALLGIAEAAFGPGVPFYLSFFFNREELALRTGLFISAAPLATSFASSLAWLILKVGDGAPIAGWRLLFMVEGFPSVVVAVFAWYNIPDSPSNARFLGRKEKRIACLRLTSHVESTKSTSKQRLQWKEIWRTLLDPKSYLTALMFFGCNVAFSSLPPFLPTIIEEMSYSPLTSQILSAPPYLFSFVVVILTAYWSDKSRARSPYVVFHTLLGSAGYFWLALSGHLRLPPLVRYAGTFAAAAGFFSAVTLIITWTMDNRRAAEGKGAGIVIMNVFGQLGPLVGTRLYPDNDAPYYVKGMLMCGIFMLAVSALAWALRRVLSRENEALKERVAYESVATEDGPVHDPDVGRGLHKSLRANFVNIL